MPKIRRGRQRKDYRVADAAKKNPENETEEIVVTEDVEEMDDLDDDDMDNAEPPANATNDTASDSLTEDKIEAGIDSEEDLLDGIPEEELTKVEDAFYMVDKSRARASGGSGLGLALCRRIAELHHAEMRIESRQGEGTKVSILWK